MYVSVTRQGGVSAAGGQQVGWARVANVVLETWGDFSHYNMINHDFVLVSTFFLIFSSSIMQWQLHPGGINSMIAFSS